MPIELKQLKARRKVAQKEYDLFKPLLSEVHEYILPYRRSIALSGKGEKRVNRVYDHTAIVSAFRSANRMAQDIAPAGQQFFDIKVGPLAAAAMDDSQKKQLQSQLETIKTVVTAHFQSGEWDTALAEMCLDLMAGTGGMYILPDPVTKMARFVAVPLDELRITSNGFGNVNGIFWPRKWALQSIADEFGTDKFPKVLLEKLTSKPDQEYTLNQDVVQDGKTRSWEYVATIEGVDGKSEELEVRRSISKTCPVLTPRYFKLPGETFGRGPAMLVTPTVKALNTGKMLTLQSAAIALMGIYTAVDDGVFNPDNFVTAPGAVNKVGSNGGPRGASIQRFADPRLDLTQMIFKDMGMEIQMGMNDQSLPLDGAAVRSATEILERVKRLASDHMGAYGRLIMEIVVPAVSRVMEIAGDSGQLGTTVNIDRLFVDIHVSSPMALAREAERMQKLTQYVDLCIHLLQSKQLGLDRYAKTDLMAMDIARNLGVPERYLPSDDDRAQQDQQAQAQQAAAMAAANPQATADAVQSLAQAA